MFMVSSIINQADVQIWIIVWVVNASNSNPGLIELEIHQNIKSSFHECLGACTPDYIYSLILDFDIDKMLIKEVSDMFVSANEVHNLE